MILAHKIQIRPNAEQAQYLQKSAGTARFVWNWGLDQWTKQYQAGQKPSGFSLKKEFNALKGEQFPWVYEVTKWASQQPFINLQKAFNSFFKKKTKYPVFKKKGKRDSFYLDGYSFKIESDRIKIPLLGWVKMSERLRWSGKIMSGTFTKRAGRWFVSVQVEIDHDLAQCENQDCVGVDLGIKNLATLSDDSFYKSPRPLKRYLKRLRRVSRRFSKKKIGSNNRDKFKTVLSKLHYKISCIRQDFLHKLTTDLTRRFKVIVIEDLNVKGMMKNRKLSRSISDMGFYEFQRQLEYKSRMYGNRICKADRWFPSSKTCSNCGWIKEDLTLNDRTFCCESCDLEIDRDHNAAINLKDTVSFTGINAFGEIVRHAALPGNRAISLN